MSYPADKLGVDTRTHREADRQTDAGNDNTRKPKLASGERKTHLKDKIGKVVRGAPDYRLSLWA